MFTEINCDFIDTKETTLLLDYVNESQHDQQRIELEKDKDYLVIEPDPEKDAYAVKEYKYLLLNDDLFNQQGVYEILATTHDEAKNTNLNNEAVENYPEETRKILKFVVLTAPPTADMNASLQNEKFKDNTHKEIVSNPCEIEDDAFSTDGKTATVTAIISSYRLDAVDLSTLSVQYDGDAVKIDQETDITTTDDNTAYQVTFTLPASNSKKSLVIKVGDKAGNGTETADFALKADNLLVSNNWFIRFVNNPYAFYPTLAGIVLVVGGIVLFIILKKKKEKDDEE